MLQGSNWGRCRRLGIQVEVLSRITKLLEERVQTLGQISVRVVFQKHRGLQANGNGDVACWHAHPGLKTGCVFIWRGFGVSVLHVHVVVLSASALACSASFPPLPGMPDHRYLLICLQTFLEFPFHTNTHTHTTHPASPRGSGLILHMLHSQMGFLLAPFSCPASGTA